MAMSAVSTVRTIAQSLGKGGAQPQGGAELHTQALVRNSDNRGDVGGGGGGGGAGGAGGDS